MGIFLKEINLKGKTALVTGATKGIGRGTAIALAQAGANIIAVGRNQIELNSLGKIIKKLKVKYISFNCDVNNYNKIREQHTIMVNGLEKDIESIKRENKNLRKATTLLGAGFLGVLVSVITLAFVK